MDVKRPSNEGILSGLDRQGKQIYQHIWKSMDAVAKKQPDMDTKVYTRFAHDWLESAKETENTIKKMKADHKSDAEINSAVDAIREKHSNAFNESLTPEDKKAMDALDKEMNEPKGIVGGAISQFYDGKKDGLRIGGARIGGILGFIGGAMLASNITGGFANGPFGIISMLGAGFLAAWLGNKMSDGAAGAVKNFMAKKSDTPAQQQQPAQEQAPEPELQNKITEELKKKAQDEMSNPTIPAGGSAATAPNALTNEANAPQR